MRCAFCGKDERQVARIVGGPGPATICDECVVRFFGEVTADDADHEALARYAAECARHYPRDEALLARARRDDPEAKDAFVRSALALAALLALALAPPGVSPLDAVQEASLVLVRLVEDPRVSDPIGALPERLAKHFEALRRGSPGPPPADPSLN